MMSYVNCLAALSQAERLQQVGWLPAPKNWERGDMLARGEHDPRGISEQSLWAAHHWQPQPSICTSASPGALYPCPKQSSQPGTPKSKPPPGKSNIKRRRRRLGQLHRQPTTGTRLQQPVSPSGDVQRHLPLPADRAGIASPPSQDWVAMHLNYRYKLGA